ncbi:MAG: sigma-70 family RNA polymerase sigma factor, partial [Actinomycetota bacterium]|nr:sigma-70 family RNA polymerase sigma factor [Actinomycetota bacterium]
MGNDGSHASVAATADPPVDADQLVRQHLGLARALARRFRSRGEPIEDLEQVALLALVKVARRFDPDRHVGFSTYATVCILGELKRHFRDRGWWVRVPRAVHDVYLTLSEANATLQQELGRSVTVAELSEHLDLSEEAVLEAIEAGSHYRPSSLDRPPSEGGRPLIDELEMPDDPYDGVLDRHRLRQALPTLSERERLVLKRYFFDGATQQEIGQDLGVSQMQVSRLLA